MSDHLTSRRTLLRAGAWATPVLAVAAAAPAATASGPTGIIITDFTSSYRVGTFRPYWCESTAMISLASGDWPSGDAVAVQFSLSGGDDDPHGTGFYRDLSGKTAFQATDSESTSTTSWTTCTVRVYTFDASGELLVALAQAGPITITGP